MEVNGIKLLPCVYSKEVYIGWWMSKEIVSIKVTEDTRKALRLIAALTGETMQEVMERLAKAEAERLIKEQK